MLPPSVCGSCHLKLFVPLHNPSFFFTDNDDPKSWERWALRYRATPPDGTAWFILSWDFPFPEHSKTTAARVTVTAVAHGHPVSDLSLVPEAPADSLSRSSRGSVALGCPQSAPPYDGARSPAVFSV